MVVHMTGEKRRTRTRRRYLRGVTVGAAAAVAGCLGVVPDELPGSGSGRTDDGKRPDGGSTASSATATSNRGSGDTPAPADTATAQPDVLHGTYRSYRAGPDRRAFAPDAGSVGVDPGVAETLRLASGVYQPIVDGRQVYLTRRRYQPGQPTVAAFDLADWTRLWARDLGAPARGPPALAGNRLFVMTSAGLRALGRAGNVDWESTAGSVGGFVPAVTDDAVFVAGDRGLTALRHDGAREWSLPLGDGPIGPPAADGTAVYVPLARGDESAVVAFDAEDGTSRWRRGTEIGDGVPPILAGDEVYASSPLVQGGVRALSAGDGSSRWRGRAPAFRPPAVTDGHVVTASRSSATAYTSDGSAAWDNEVVGTVVAGPVATPDTVYVGAGGDDTSVLYAFDLATGERRWTLSLDWALDALPAVLDGGLLAATRDDEAGSERLLVVTGADSPPIREGTATP